MSEKYNFQIEENKESEEKSEHQEAVVNKIEQVEHKNKHQEHIKNIREKVNETSKKSAEIDVARADKAPKQNHAPLELGSQVQAQALKQTLKKVQKKLPVHERQFSKLIHNTTVEKISQASGSTLARPSGLLFAGIFSLIASIVILTVCRYYGYEYNYFIGLASLGFGFIAGLLIESGYRLVSKAKSR